MLWIILTGTDDNEVRIDAQKILEISSHSKYTVVYLERMGDVPYKLRVKEDPEEIVAQIRSQHQFATGRAWAKSMTPTTDFWDPRTGAQNKGSWVRSRPEWDAEHDQVRQELINELPELFPQGKVPPHLEIPLNSNVALFVRNRRQLRKDELEDLSARIVRDKEDPK